MYKFISSIFGVLLFLSPLFADISVTPYGAAESVSGSCFLLDNGDKKFIVDCGLFMSDVKDLDNNISTKDKNLNIQKGLVDAHSLFLTHAHLDHSGRIPLLIQEGFKGKIYSTGATKELAIALFKDRNGFDLIKRKWFWSESQYEKAEKKNGAVVAHWTNECKSNIKSIGYSESEMLLDDLEKNEKVKFILCKNCCQKEAEKISEKFVIVDYNEDIQIVDMVKAKFINAAHIPGSASIIFTIDKEKICFSGDLGSGHSKFNGEFEIPEPVDLIFMEATYGGKINNNVDVEYKIFRKDLKNALASGNTIWIPAFALNRTQEVLYELKLMQDDGYISKEIPIFSVSPSANAITNLYQKEVSNPIREDEDNKYSQEAWFLDSVYQKKSILPKDTRFQMIRNYNMQMILFSSSGDMDRGKSEQLAPIMLSDKNVFVMIVNYVDPASPASLLLQNKKTKFNLKKVAAKIKSYQAFSDHADFNALQKWLSKQNKDTKIYVIHSNKQNTAQTVALLRAKNWSNVYGAKLGETLY
jgi:metallo-beta-lactamase family protein